MNLYKYSRVYSYGDCEESYLIKADTEEDALNEIRKYKEERKSYNKIVDINCLELVDFEGDNIVEV